MCAIPKLSVCDTKVELGDNGKHSASHGVNCQSTYGFLSPATWGVFQATRADRAGSTWSILPQFTQVAW